MEDDYSVDQYDREVVEKLLHEKVNRLEKLCERLEMRNRDAEWLVSAFQQLAADNNIRPSSTQLIAAHRKSML